MPEAAEELVLRAGRREKSGAHVALACLALGASALGLTGCPALADPECDQRRVLAVSDDRAVGGPTYVLRAAGFAQGDPYTLARTDRAVPLASVVGDGTSAELLAPSGGGVIVVGDGAAAQRFDATGTSLWTVGYDSLGTHGALPSDDQLILADATTVRALSPDGEIAWERALAVATTGVSQVVADRAGGAWVVGAFAGSFAPWVVGARTDGLTIVGHFIIRFDGAGDVVAANAWDDTNDAGLAWTQALAVARDDGSTELVLVGSANPGSGAVPALDITREAGDGPFVVAFDASARLLWSRPLNSGVQLAADAAGNLLALSAASSVDAGAPTTSTGLVSGAPASANQPDTSGLVIERWDASGAPLVASDAATATRTTVAVPATPYGGLTWASAPTNGGLVIAGQWLAESSSEDAVVACPQRAFAFGVQTESLTVTPLMMVAP